MNLKELAKSVGVSIATVSKVLNHYPDVAESTRQKVLEAVAKTGYRLPLHAQSLIGQSRLIALVFASTLPIDLNNAYFSDVLDGLKKRASEMRCDLLLFSEQSFSMKEDYVARCRHYHTDGCIVIAGDPTAPALQRLVLSEIPCVGIDLELTGTSTGYVTCNQTQIGEIAAEYIHDRQYQKPGYLGPGTLISLERENGYRTVFEKYGYEIRQEWFVRTHDFFEFSGYFAMKEMLKQPELPRVIFAASDLLAIGAMKAIIETGRKVPEDIAVIGCDDILHASLCSPSLTTVRIDKGKLGIASIDMLFDLLNGRTTSPAFLMEPELIIRHSG
ncbi:LacI family DNA-binding transcriptional regulator [Cohnella abietis]|uniref:LacI family transcriptional regulator n=1 Tax=Cohnella abietis TaxID=2507935 RepID=A0A3T1DBY6_9BACL|nr:LacI family DNA-binding transcriptional regulator [Cohnella abietis]BBI35612.1 LacI family transcriptional regulator [Cohnella abietis]